MDEVIRRFNESGIRYLSKEAAGRPQDLEDAAFLRAKLAGPIGE